MISIIGMTLEQAEAAFAVLASAVENDQHTEELLPVVQQLEPKIIVAQKEAGMQIPPGPVTDRKRI